MCAKDFFMNEKLLIIAPRVPLFDQNSGDLRLFSILEILSNSYEITYLTRATPGEDESYIGRLKDLGIIVADGQSSFSRVLKADRFLAAVLEFYFVAEYYLPRIRILQPTCRIVIDSVDIAYRRLFLKYETTNDPEDLCKAEEAKERESDIYGKADTVITVSEEDGEFLRRDGGELHIRVIPNVHRIVSGGSAKNRNELVFVGGFSHDPNVDAMLYFCRSILPLIRKEVPDVKLTIVGSHPPDEVRSLADDTITVTGHVPTVSPYLSKSYISIAPLRYGSGMKGKIGEAMAHGRPVVTTSVGAQGMGLMDGTNVLIADTPEDFAKGVIQLIQDEKLYGRIQMHAVDHVKNHYTRDQVGRHLAEMMAELRMLRPKKMNVFEKTGFWTGYGLNRFRKKLQFSRPNLVKT
jgi:glycosyltransferase involved in cell wall biosynthesis